MAQKMPILPFHEQIVAALKRCDGYIMGATGQDPKKWEKNSWWFTQYSGEKRTKALYWREHAARVWDCNGMAEGIYQNYTGVSINTYARLNYANWCGIKGSGIIPTKYRVPGAAVFWGSSAADIHHVAYLDKPVNPNNPGGDWFIIEARGVMYGVVQTRLYSRLPNYWGLMDKYFDYSAVLGSGAEAVTPVMTHLGDRLLKNGTEGEDVRELQNMLVDLGYDCGKWGCDGDFGDATEMAVKAFQAKNGLEVDGKVGPKTVAALDAAMAAQKQAEANPKTVEIVGGTCYVRTAPKVDPDNILGAVIAGTKLPYDGMTSDDGWHLIEFKGKNGWVSGKYGKLVG